MSSALFFRNHPVELRVSSPEIGFISISLVSDDVFEKVYLELTVQDDFSHAFSLVKELLDYYES